VLKESLHARRMFRRDEGCKENVNMASTEMGLESNALTLKGVDGKWSIEPNPFTVGDSIFRLLS
jgi:hypothetical protein